MKKHQNKLIINNFIKKSCNYGSDPWEKMIVKKYQSKITTIISNVKSDSFNIVCNGDFTKTKTFKNGEKIINHFNQHHQQFSWWISEKFLNKQAKQFFSDLNLSLIEKETVMFANINDIKIQVVEKANFRIEKVETEQQYLLFINLVIKAFYPSDIKIIEFFQSLNWYKNSNFCLFLGYFEDNAICTGSIYFSDKIAGIYDVTTSEEYRNQGFAKILFVKLISVIETKKWNYIALQSTLNAIDFYRKLGFTPLFNLYNYSQLE